MAQARMGDKVKVHYRGELEDGSVFDTSAGGEPLEFVLGSGGVIPGFEQAVVGMAPGESKTAHIPSAEAYGEHRPELLMSLERAEMPSDFEVEVGQQLALSDPSGRTLVVSVVEMTPETVTLDANHLLAGEDLTFHIDLVEVEPASMIIQP